ncbi:MAG: hypothetical protein ABH826_03315 [Patescibacteria group bacterium]|nr:hypothetical protein [Patescibacteria group bacterium]
MEDFLSFYPLVSILLALVWLLLFLRQEEVRKEMLILGVFSLFILPTTILVLSRAEDVTNSLANFTLFDLLFAFTVAGIAGAVYHNFFGKHYHLLSAPKSRKQSADVQLYLLRMFIIILLFVWAVVFLTYFFAISTALAMLITASCLGIYIVVHRKDLLRDTIWSGVLTTIVVFIAGTLVSTISGATLDVSLVESSKMIGSVPLDLLLWSLALGLAAGPLYEYTRHIELK